MAFQARCEKKGCGKTIEPVVDKTTKKVYCPCSESCEIKHISKFAVNQLIFMGQIKKIQHGDLKAFSIKCASCQAFGTPVVNGDNISCSKCEAEITNLSSQFKTILIEKLKA